MLRANSENIEIELRSQLNESIERYNDLAIQIPDAKSVITGLLDILNKLKIENEELKAKVEAATEALKTQQIASEVTINLLKGRIEALEQVISIYETITATHEFEQSLMNDAKSEGPDNRVNERVSGRLIPSIQLVSAVTQLDSKEEKAEPSSNSQNSQRFFNTPTQTIDPTPATTRPRRHTIS